MSIYAFYDCFPSGFAPKNVYNMLSVDVSDWDGFCDYGGVLSLSQEIFGTSDRAKRNVPKVILAQDVDDQPAQLFEPQIALKEMSQRLFWLRTSTISTVKMKQGLRSSLPQEYEHTRRFNIQASSYISLCKEILQSELITDEGCLRGLVECANSTQELIALMVASYRRKSREENLKIIQSFSTMEMQLDRMKDLMEQLLANFTKNKEKTRRFEDRSASSYLSTEVPGPSGCNFWRCRCNNNFVDDGETAFMILED
ncbi:hypothetical protein Q1695_014824 [Nippostrongylus brasiliensis]|nr:hypothetical protein Q1695_014824 [Nippostrongylus brasiliensis]